MAATLNIGVIGMGWMGQAHSRSYINVPLRFPEAGIRPNLVICSDNVAARADSARDTLGFRQSTTRWQDVIEHPDVQVVNICTPNDLHVEIVRAAAAAGKHIFCEKPVGRTPHETAQAEAAAREAGIISGVGFNYRWVPLVQHARHLLESGSIGPLELWRGRFFSMYGANPLGLLTWRFDKNIAGSGVLGDLMSHVVDMTLFLAHHPRRRAESHVHQGAPDPHPRQRHALWHRRR
jgi:predicted dehydrogenase